MIDWEYELKLSLDIRGGGYTVDLHLRIPNLPPGLEKPLWNYLLPRIQHALTSEVAEQNRCEGIARRTVLEALAQRFESCVTLEDVIQILEYQLAVTDGEPQ